MEDIVNIAKQNFWDNLAKHEDIFHLDRHLEKVAIWAEKLADQYPQTDREVLMLSVWLHDIAHYPVDSKTDHAVAGEEITKKFLKQHKYPEEKIKFVAHCVRAHRCKDVQPESIEAKILVFSDSASHMIDQMYLDIVQDGRGDYALGKLERDYRDIGLFPELQKKLTPLYKSWKMLIEEFIKLT